MKQVIQPENCTKCGNAIKSKKRSQEAKSKIKYRSPETQGYLNTSEKR